MKFKKILFILFIVASAVLLALLSINTVVLDQTSAYILTEPQALSAQPFDAILVLGAKVHSENRLSAILQDRVDCALRLYDGRASGKLLVSGDHGQADYDEVNACKLYLLEKAVPVEDIFLDHAGFSTYESMYRARDIFQVKRVLIVTQRFHLSRAIYIARGMGLDAYGVTSDTRAYYGAKLNALREFFARPKDYLYTNIFHPLPKYLGETIPISGSGLLTQD